MYPGLFPYAFLHASTLDFHLPLLLANVRILPCYSVFLSAFGSVPHANPLPFIELYTCFHKIVDLSVFSFLRAPHPTPLGFLQANMSKHNFLVDPDYPSRFSDNRGGGVNIDL